MTAATKQRAIIQTSYGDAARALSSSNSFPIASPSPTEVQVEIAAASLNPIDWQMIEGNRRMIAPRAFPFTPLFDIAGTVTAIGAGVTRFKTGDHVHADNEKYGGGGAERINVDQSLVALIPPGLDFARAAAIPLAGQTALMALDKGGVGPGSRVCVVGASGGVGAFAVQLAKALGAADIVGVCSQANGSFVLGLGATRLVDYRTTTLTQALGRRSVDVVLDCVGGRDKWLEAERILVPSGKFVTIARDEDGEVTLPSMLSLIATIYCRQFRSNFGNRIAYIPVFLKASAPLLERINAFVASGAVKVPISRVFPRTLDGILAAIELSKTGRVVGKIVLSSATELRRPSQSRN